MKFDIKKARKLLKQSVKEYQTLTDMLDSEQLNQLEIYEKLHNKLSKELKLI